MKRSPYKKLLLAVSLTYAILLRLALFAEVPQYYCTAANAPYYTKLLNLIGSLHKTNYENIKEIAVFDLGLSQEMIDHLNSMQKVKVYKITADHTKLSLTTFPRLGWYSWKPVVIHESLDLFPYVLWIDAGSTVLQPIGDLFEYIVKTGYFVCTIGDNKEHPEYPVGWGTTTFVKKKFQLDTSAYAWILSKESPTSAIVGATKTAPFMQEWYELTKDIRFFADDGSAPGIGRHDQIVLSILSYQKGLNIHHQDWSQQEPMLLPINGKDIPFYITWHSDSVCKKTCIYSSRNDLRHYNTHLNSIRYRAKKAGLQ